MSSIASPHPSSSVTRSLCGTGNTQLDCQQSPFGNTGSTWTHLRPAPPPLYRLFPASCFLCHVMPCFATPLTSRTTLLLLLLLLLILFLLLTPVLPFHYCEIGPGRARCDAMRCDAMRSLSRSRSLGRILPLTRIARSAPPVAASHDRLGSPFASIL